MMRSSLRRTFGHVRRRNSRTRTVVLVAALGLAAAHVVYGEDPVPLISDAVYASNGMELAISNVDTGGTYYIESAPDLTLTNWAEVDCFGGLVLTTNWTDSGPGSSTSAYYRVVREPNHPKVGDVATFTTVAHLVEGTAHIVNNCTVELRNFHYDGGGIVVEVWASPNTSFSPYTSLSGNLVGQAFANDTLTLSIPEGADLSTFSYISIWCVDVSFSFGTGMFE